MHRAPLLMELQAYQQTWASGLIAYQGFNRIEETEMITRLQTFVRRREDCLQRSCEEGHITASAMICNQDMSRVLLTLHGKLGKWLQLGGHIDDETDVAEAAEREAREESGLTEFTRVVLPPSLLPAAVFMPFDCDIHCIPARGKEAAHLHYDVRYLLRTDDFTPLQISAESKALQWFDLNEARAVTHERSMHRQFDKLDHLQDHFATLK